ncbi:CRISPR type I-F/YPEST-associated protein Csy2 [Pragia fontium]|uniref:CRISPR-associated protein Csy2 n=2 Tax=Pragia fontium TaxID=82985 RepID=A0AAJ4WDC3_9GAMM|nr:type I-F CRISPR-associated protein Csy2 [Pragia fontium]AKJ43481.1 CRISPR-associated protein [Pragia fontium]GKX64178.1 CRISPR type I-F system protein Csy2 [Pragia fontium]SFD38086.1 CRISPR-associated protein Csy2 [Pragia fontium DSM 5563 = ATCC 49100]SUB83968.1 CRISPR type I-F/YPEST-associated protein Csy2 [Pragia fontium]
MNVLILPHINIHNANALSSSFTIGFPAMTAWLGFVHALERKLNQAGLPELMLHSAAVVSHRCDVQTHKGEGDFVHSIIGTGNPLDKDGSRSAFIEEARCHLDVSLVIEWGGNEDQVQHADFAEQLQAVIATMKVAGGDVLSMHRPLNQSVDIDNPQETRALLRKLMPGYVLIERRDLMTEAMAQGSDALDALLSYLTVNHRCEQLEDGSVIWRSQRKASGWIVPIATGFQGISPLGEAKNQRDPSVPHRFAESVVTLGEFVMAHKIQHLDDMLWHYHNDLENDLYLCQQVNAINEHQ